QSATRFARPPSRCPSRAAGNPARFSICFPCLNSPFVRLKCVEIRYNERGCKALFLVIFKGFGERDRSPIRPPHPGPVASTRRGGPTRGGSAGPNRISGEPLVPVRSKVQLRMGRCKRELD